MNRNFCISAFVLGLLAALWVASSYIGGSHLALVVTLVITAVYISGALELRRFQGNTEGLAKALRHAGPWGQHFPEPLFHGVFQIVNQRVVGEKHLKLVLKTECGGQTLDGIAFNVDRDVWPNPNVRWVELAYKLDVNEYQGRESVQLLVAHLAPR